MLSKVLAAALAVTAVSAQTFTDCNPLLKTCPDDDALGATQINDDFTKGKDKFLTVLTGTNLKYDGTLGATYTINSKDDAPTTQSDQSIFFGELTVEVQAAPGAGIVTSVVLQSDDLDEIDWEWVGGDNAQVQTNFFSKGCTEVYNRGGFSPVTNPQGQFHTYTIKWTPQQLDWIIDGTVVRTLVNDGTKGCSGYPQTPMRVRLGTWVAGKPGAAQGTIDWAGGLANFANAPFVGYYKSLKVVDYMGGNGAKSATSYHYSDNSGDWQSIKVLDNGKSAGDDKSGSKQDTTSSSSSSSAAATTLSTVSSTSGFSNATTTGTAATASKTAPTTSAPASAPTNAAGQLALSLGNAALMGTGLFLGALAFL